VRRARKKLRVGPDYRATEKADRSARFECTRCFNGSLGKRRKTAGECRDEVSRSTLSGLSSLMQLRGTAYCVMKETYCIRAETFIHYLHYFVLIRKDWAATCDHRKEIFVREFRFQILSRPVKVLCTQDGRLLLLPRKRFLIANAHCPPPTLFSHIKILSQLPTILFAIV